MQSPGAPPRPRAAALTRGAFAALRHRNFRLFYAGQLLSLVGTWMQSTAQGWLVLELTDSALLLGTVTAAGSLPVLLFTLYAGVVADRVDKRRIIVAAQAGAAMLALARAVLTDTGRVT
ncbi:MAG TPA: MFS transporter, partial [Longimicrobiaceae bacterium]|nr:MFS transporter [Longimicrobiaceae bacterium]